MKHHIIVKFNDKVLNLDEMYQRVLEHFAPVKQLEGVTGLHIYRNCIPRDNRYNLMIVIEMEKNSLSIFDASEIHIKWKENFGQYIESKAIFDCED